MFPANFLFAFRCPSRNIKLSSVVAAIPDSLIREFKILMNDVYSHRKTSGLTDFTKSPNEMSTDGSFFSFVGGIDQ